VDEGAVQLSNPSEAASTDEQSVVEFARRSLEAAVETLWDLQMQQNQAKRLVRQALEALRQLPGPATAPVGSVHESPFLSVAEVANSYGVSRSQVWRMVRDGTVPSCKLGQRVVVPRDALTDWEEALRGQGLG
jgi:excisionase family DNA binding protein